MEDGGAVVLQDRTNSSREQQASLAEKKKRQQRNADEKEAATRRVTRQKVNEAAEPEDMAVADPESSAGEPPVPSLVESGPVVELKVNGSRDIDVGDDDPQLASSYVTDIHQHLLSMEVRGRDLVTCVPRLTLAFPLAPPIQHKYRAPSNYMSLQEDITERMRTILIDWYDHFAIRPETTNVQLTLCLCLANTCRLVDVHLKFKLVPETLYITVNYIDRFLAKTQEPVRRNTLQLVRHQLLSARLLSARRSPISSKSPGGCDCHAFGVEVRRDLAS